MHDSLGLGRVNPSPFDRARPGGVDRGRPGRTTNTSAGWAVATDMKGSQGIGESGSVGTKYSMASRGRRIARPTARGDHRVPPRLCGSRNFFSTSRQITRHTLAIRENFPAPWATAGSRSLSRRCRLSCAVREHGTVIGKLAHPLETRRSGVTPGSRPGGHPGAIHLARRRGAGPLQQGLPVLPVHLHVRRPARGGRLGRRHGPACGPIRRPRSSLVGHQISSPR